MLLRSALCCALLTILLPAIASDYPLEMIMANPDWIGNEPQNPYFSDDGGAVYFEQKRSGENYLARYRVATDGNAAPEALDDAAPIASSNASRAYSNDGRQVVWTYDGDVFTRSLPAGPVLQLTRTSATETNARFLADGVRVAYVADGRFRMHNIATGEVADFADLKFEDNPDEPAEFDTLRANQERLYTTVVEDARRAEAAAAAARERQAASPNGAPLPVYLGKGLKEWRRDLSPNGRHLLLVTRPADHPVDKAGTMPNYVTASGFTETRELRTRVGRQLPAPHTLWLYDAAERQVREIALTKLPDFDTDPLADLRKSALTWHVERGADEETVENALAAPEQRGVQIEQIHWNAAGTMAAVQIHSVDNKDRWIATVDVSDGSLTAQHHLHDPAWINYNHNDMGWLPGADALWYLSEESGYSQLYLKPTGIRRARALTKGRYVVSSVSSNADGSALYFRANQPHPGTYEIYRVDPASGAITQVTSLGGVNDYFLSPDGRQIGISHSEYNRHPDLFVVSADANAAPIRLTDTVTAAFKAIDWVKPEIVEVPSSHVAEPIYSKLYLPKDYSTERRYPAVMFVHGAGYTQNAHAGWPYYFREFLFHSLLTERGFIVIDMDYRASRGYGRDWRTAIYRQMGHPELEDFVDGVKFLSENYNVDPNRVGVYGGSYGGFMTFMALFREPELFAAGAALRPVADWAHYNHGYTANILNTPLLDPVAYEKSSPIYFAEGLTKPLLIAAGMQDDNVFFQDSVLMVQRLTELEKDDFELAAYPLDPHGFVHANAWLDEYKRVLKLMESTLLTN